MKYIEDKTGELMTILTWWVSCADLVIPSDVYRFILSILENEFFAKDETRSDGLFSKLFTRKQPRKFTYSYKTPPHETEKTFKVIIRHMETKKESFELFKCAVPLGETPLILTALQNHIHLNWCSSFTCIRVKYDGLRYEYGYNRQKETDLIALCNEKGYENIVFIAECSRMIFLKSFTENHELL